VWKRRSQAQKFDSKYSDRFWISFSDQKRKKSFDLFGSGRQLWLVLIDIKCGGAAKKTPTEVLRQRGEISTGSISETPSVSIIQTC
jgi:hypothetical protein